MKHLLPRLLTFTLVMALGVVCVNTTHAQFFDNFDGYTDGTVLSDPGTQNDWRGWNGAAGAAGVVSSAQSQSAPHSMAAGPAVDAVNTLGVPTSGKWDFTADWYVPSGLVNQQYWIMMNRYEEGLAVNGNWAIQIQCDGVSGTVIDDLNGGAPVPILFDQWVQVRAIIDLDNNTLSQFYDGQEFGPLDQEWAAPNTPVAIGAADLFSNQGTTAYWDNVSLAVFVDEPVTVPGESLTVAPGIINSGGLGDLTDSDNVSLVLFRDPTSTAAVTQFVLSATSPSASPSAMDFVLEGRCVSRPNVVQRVEMFDFVAGAYETVDEQNAVRMPPDLSITVSPTGDLSRFVDQTTNEIRARVRYRADSPRASFSSRTDQAVWMITP